VSLTCQQIVADACTIAKVPGMIAYGGRCLNKVLLDLVLHRDLKINRFTQFLTVQANSNGPFNLEANYLRTYDLFYQVNNLPYFLYPVTIEQYDAEFKDPSISNYPYEYATDLSPQTQNPPGLAQVYIYPQSSGQITLTHRYMVQQPDIVTPETSSAIPWFPDYDWLTRAVAVRLFEITDDDRHDKWTMRLDEELRVHLCMEGDEQQTVRAVRLDPRRFHTNRTLRPTKVTG